MGEWLAASLERSEYVRHCDEYPAGVGAPSGARSTAAIDAIATVEQRAPGTLQERVPSAPSLQPAATAYDIADCNTGPAVVKEPRASASGGFFPLTGLPATAGHRGRPAVVVKLEEADSRWKQRAVNDADIVVEVETEGTPRILAVYQSVLPDSVGPVRSARNSDPAIMPAFGRPLFAWSGANEGVRGYIEAAAKDEYFVDVSPDREPSEYISEYNTDEESSSVRLFTNPVDLLISTGSSSSSPRQMFEYSSDPGLGERVAGVAVDWGLGYHSEFLWNPDVSGWLRIQHDRLYVEEDGTVVSPTNVVLLVTHYIDSISDRESRQACSTGSGSAVILTDGVRIDGTWARPTIHDAWSLNLPDESPIKLAPGRTWIVLLDRGMVSTLSDADAQDRTSAIQGSP